MKRVLLLLLLLLLFLIVMSLGVLLLQDVNRTLKIVIHSDKGMKHEVGNVKVDFDQIGDFWFWVLPNEGLNFGDRISDPQGNLSVPFKAGFAWEGAISLSLKKKGFRPISWRIPLPKFWGFGRSRVVNLYIFPLGEDRNARYAEDAVEEIRYKDKCTLEYYGKEFLVYDLKSRLVKVWDGWEIGDLGKRDRSLVCALFEGESFLYFPLEEKDIKWVKSLRLDKIRIDCSLVSSGWYLRREPFFSRFYLLRKNGEYFRWAGAGVFSKTLNGIPPYFY